jgi:organic radical activating enzyme
MKELICIESNKNKTLRIMYDLGNVCNYKCWYCFPGSNEGTTGWPEVEIVKYNIVKLIQFYFDNSFNDINLNLLGGEPSLWKDLGEFVLFIKTNIKPKWNQKLRISMQTNSSRTLRWWKEYGIYFDHVSISVHGERADPLHVSKVGQILVDQGVFCFASVLMDHMNWDKCVKIVDDMLKTNTSFMIEVKPIHLGGVYQYSEQQLNYMKSSIKRKFPIKQIIQNLKTVSSIPTFKGTFSDGSVIKTKSVNDFTINGHPNFNGWECSLGQSWLYIDRDGRLTGTCKNKIYGIDYFYNINDKQFVEKFNPTLQPTICQQNECLCQGEVVLPKRKI